VVVVVGGGVGLGLLSLCCGLLLLLSLFKLYFYFFSVPLPSPLLSFPLSLSPQQQLGVTAAANCFPSFYCVFSFSVFFLTDRMLPAVKAACSASRHWRLGASLIGPWGQLWWGRDVSEWKRMW
jgi:hypothetical protein